MRSDQHKSCKSQWHKPWFDLLLVAGWIAACGGQTNRAQEQDFGDAGDAAQDAPYDIVQDALDDIAAAPSIANIEDQFIDEDTTLVLPITVTPETGTRVWIE